MSEKNILTKFVVTVYTDGSITTENIMNSDEISSISDEQEDRLYSSRIEQIIEVLKRVIIIYRNDIEGYYEFDNDMLGTIFTQAIKETAQKYHVTTNSVFDKLGRQCNMKKADWEDELENMLIQRDFSSVKKTLLKNIVRSRKGDLELIKEFEKFFNENYLNSDSMIEVDSETEI